MAARPVGTVLTLDPTASVLLPGETRPPHAPGAPRGRTRPLAVGRVIWKSLKPEIATVDTAGIVIGVAPGQEHRAGHHRRPDSWPPCRWKSKPGRVRARRRKRGPRPRRGGDALRVLVPSQGNRPLARRHAVALGRHAPSPPSARLASCRRGSPGRTEIVVVGVRPGAARPALLVHRLPQTLVCHTQADGRAASSSRSAPTRPVHRGGRSRRFHADSRGAGRVGGRRHDDRPASIAPPAPSPPATPAPPRSPRGCAGSSRSSGASRSCRACSVWTAPASVFGLGERVTLAANLLDDAGKVLGPGARRRPGAATSRKWPPWRTERCAA